MKSHVVKRLSEILTNELGMLSCIEIDIKVQVDYFQAEEDNPRVKDLISKRDMQMDIVRTIQFAINREMS